MKNTARFALLFCALITLSGCQTTPSQISYADISGIWKYHLLVNNVIQSTSTVTLQQTANAFEGADLMWTFSGSVYGNTTVFTMVVTGETAEGFVRKVDASVHNGTLITGVWIESNSGNVGSFIAMKQ